MPFTTFAASAGPFSASARRHGRRRRALSRVLGNQKWEVAPACRHVRCFLQDHGLSRRALFACDLVVEEVLRNAVTYAYEGGGSIRVDAEVGAEKIVLTFTDHGRRFDPSQPRQAEREGLDESPVGGLGLRLVAATASAVFYRRISRANRTVVVITR